MKNGRMNIAHIGWVASCHLVRRADELCRRGMNCIVFTDNIPNHFVSDEHGFLVEKLPNHLFSKPLELIAWLEGRLKHHNIDLLHAHSTHFPASLGFFVRHTPVIGSPWDFVHSKDPFSPLFHQAILQELPHERLMDAVSFSSKPFMKDVIDRGLSPQRAYWHSWGVDLAMFKPGVNRDKAKKLRKAIGVAEDEIMLLSPRTPSLPANNDIAMQAVAALRGRHKVKLVITGHFIPREFIYYENLASRPDIAASTIFLDSIHEDASIATLYEAAEVVLSLHNNDYNPATVLESFAMKRPILVNDLETVSFWVDHEKNGWITRARELDETISMLDHILTVGAERWATMGAEGRKRVERLADFQKTMDMVPTHYAKVIHAYQASSRPPLTAYDKGLLHDICNLSADAASFYQQAAANGENRSLLYELYKEKVAMESKDKGLSYFHSQRSQPVVRAMVGEHETLWQEMAKQLPIPMSLFRHDFLVALLPCVEAGDCATFHGLIQILADRFKTDTLEWVGEAMLLFGRRFGLWEACAPLLLETPNGGTSLAVFALEAVDHLGEEHPLSAGLLDRADLWTRKSIAHINPNWDKVLRSDIRPRVLTKKTVLGSILDQKAKELQSETIR